MYEVINDYFGLRLAEFNAANSDYLVATSITLNRNRLPLNQRQANYTVKLDSFNSEQNQTEDYKVSGVVELTFSMVNKKVVDYEAVQQYIYKLARYIRRKENYNVSNVHFGIVEIGAEDLDNLNAGSTELTTQLTFTGEYYETNAIGVSAPSAPTLTSPADGSTSGVVDQSFQWTSVANALTYTFELSGTNGVILTQTGLTVSSFTIPADSVLTNGSTYNWRVRAVGEGGSSAWTSYFDFTVNDDPNPAVVTLIEPLASTETSLTVTFLWTLSTNSTSYDIQIASDSGFSSLLVDTNVSRTSYEYTFSADATYYWRVRGENSLGNSAWASSSVIVDAPIADFTTGLIHKWKADELLTSDSAGISSWTDSVGSLAATQGTGANKPVLVTNFINGKPAVYFNNDNHYLSFTAQTWGTYTIYVVYNATSFTSGDANVMIGGTGGDIYSAIRVLTGGYGVGNGSSFRDVAYNASDTGWGIRTFQSVKVFKNKTEAASYRGTGTISSITVGTIGKRNSSLYPFKGYISEIRVYNTVHNQTQINAVSDYLNSLYAIY